MPSRVFTLCLCYSPPRPTYRLILNPKQDTEAGNGWQCLIYSPVITLPEDVRGERQEVEKSGWGWAGKPQGKWSLPRWLPWQLWPCPSA